MSVTLDELGHRMGVDVPAQVQNRVVERLLTDSRSLLDANGTLFFALHTRTGDGHFYLRSLYNRGVRMFVVERVPESMFGLDDAILLRVPDSLTALQAAGCATTGYHGHTVAVCGSRGKTVTKEMLYQALSMLAGADKTYRSPRSFNSQTGVPLSLWHISDAVRYAVIEAGISQVGEMSRLRDMIRPEVALFTSLDAGTHAEGFGSVRQKAQQKSEMARGAAAVVYNGDNRVLAEAIESVADGRRLWWSRTDSVAPIYIRCEQRMASATRLTLGTGETYTVPFVTPYEVEDAIAVLGTLMALGFSADDIQRALAALLPVRIRLDVVEGVNGCTVAVDGYRADMSSMPAALDFMRRHSSPRQRLTLVTGDLQDASEKDYRQLSSLLSGNGVERIVAVGSGMQAHAALLPEGSQVFSDVNALFNSLSVDDFSGEYVMIKSTIGDGLEQVAEMLAARKHETVLEVNLAALSRNYAAYKRRLPEGTRITAMVKASAYGMGSYEISRTLQDLGADYVAVAVLDEGLELRRRGISMPVMVMNPKAVNYRSMFANRLEPEIYSMSMLEEVIAAACANGVKEYPVHIKLDTGMHRTGFEPKDLEELCGVIASQTSVRASSVFSHLATADCPDMDAYTLRQIQVFESMTEYMSRHLPQPFLRHILNSAGIVRFPQYAYDMVRLGIGLYGINTLPEPVENPLEPVARLRTVIISLRQVASGEAVGYGRRGQVERQSLIATLPIGYADGFSRHFGNGAVSVKINGRWAPSIGNVCMDQCMVDVTGIDCQVGDTVEIFGPHTPVERLADAADTIPYEILTSVSPRVKRIYYRE